jgi:hypothetical protein
MDWLWQRPLEEREADGSTALRALHKRRTAKSNQKRNELAEKHWTNEPLARAYALLKNPKVGRDRLAKRARQLLAEEFEARLARQKLAPKAEKKARRREAARRDEVTKHRARKFLEAIHRKPGAV